MHEKDYENIKDSELPGYVNPDMEPEPECHNCGMRIGVEKCTAGCEKFVCEKCADDDGECVNCQVKRHDREKAKREARADIARELKQDTALDAIWDTLGNFAGSIR